MDCCSYSQKEEDDECGLDILEPTGWLKALEIFNCSCIKPRFDTLKIGISVPYE